MERRTSGEFHLNGIHCSLTIRSYPCKVVMLIISGTDIGEFGDKPMAALKECLRDSEPLHLFIDARDVRGASISVSGEWAVWLRKHKASLQNISMLTGSRYVEVTAEFVRRFAELEGIMRVYTEAAAFDASVAEALSQGSHEAAAGG